PVEIQVDSTDLRFEMRADLLRDVRRRGELLLDRSMQPPALAMPDEGGTAQNVACGKCSAGAADFQPAPRRPRPHLNDQAGGCTTCIRAGFHASRSSAHLE